MSHFLQIHAKICAINFSPFKRAQEIIKEYQLEEF